MRVLVRSEERWVQLLSMLLLPSVGTERDSTLSFHMSVSCRTGERESSSLLLSEGVNLSVCI